MNEPDLDAIVRDALRELAGEARPTPLLNGAAARARAIRRRRGSAAAGVAAALALAVALPLMGGGGAQPVPGASSTATDQSPTAPEEDELYQLAAGPLPVRTDLAVPTPPDLPDGFTVTAMGLDGASLLYDRVTRRYTAVDYSYAAPAPVGTQALVVTDPAHGPVALADLSNRTARQVPQLTGVRPSIWSPDGRLLLMPPVDSGLMNTLRVDTGVGVGYLYHDQGGCTPELCPAAWRRDGSVSIPVVDPDTGVPTGTRMLSERGEPTGTLPVKGVIAGACSWSTDDRYVLVKLGTQLQIVEAASGNRVGTVVAPGVDPGLMCWSAPDRLLVPIGGHVKVLGPTGALQQDIPVPAAGAWMTIGPR